MWSSARSPGPTHVAAAMLTPASLIAAATRASAPGSFSMSITRSNGTRIALSQNSRDNRGEMRRGSRARREPETARVVVAQTGFAPAESGTAEVSYGVELVNDSYEFDAIDVVVRWRLLGANGDRLDAGEVRLVAVPASTTFYIGGRARIVAKARA